MAEQAGQQVGRPETAREDLDARVDALLREMESVSGRVERELNEAPELAAPSLKDLPETPNVEEGRSKRERATRVMSDAAAELAGSKVVQGGPPAADDGDGGTSVEALDNLLAAAAADVMAQEDELAAEAPVIVDVPAEEEGAGAPAVALPGVTPATPADGAGPAPAKTADAGVDEGVDEAVGAAVIDATSRVLEVMASPRKEEKGNGPPSAPAATMAPPAEQPGPAQRIVDLFVHSVAGAAASARPHAIRLLWRMEQYTLRLSTGVRATLKLLAVWTLLNAAAAWVFVMMQTPETARGATEEVPTVISGAGHAAHGEGEHAGHAKK